MKCDELTPIDLECNMGKDINGVEHREPWKAYDIDEVNAAIAELKAENRRLKRALWLARLRSLRNFSVLAYFQTLGAKGKKSNMDFDEMAYRIDLARVKCRAKAEEY